MTQRCFLGAALGLTLAFVPARAENWPRFRGPDGNAVSSESPLPTTWSTTSNVRWKTAIPGKGFSSPVVWDDRIFVTSAFDHGLRRAVHCLDRAGGKLLWSREIEDQNPERTSSMTGHAAATVAADGRRVVAFFGNAGAVCYNYAGKCLWKQTFGEFDTELGLASSPVIHRGRVFLVCDHDGSRINSFDSFLAALDLETGKVVWKTERRGLYRSWSTPIVVPGKGGKPELLVNAQEHLRAYDPDTGQELWRVGGMTGWVTPAPVFTHGLVFAASGKNGPVMAIRPGGRGDVTASHVVWKHATGGPYVCSPLVSGDHLYLHTEDGFLSCYEARTGKRLYQERLGGKFIASPVAGDGKVYLTNEEGTTLVLKAGPKFEVLSRNRLEEYTLASPAISQQEIYLRTEKHLYAIAGK
jgi:hypothetical protein